MADVTESADAPADDSTTYLLGMGDRFLGGLGHAGDRDWIALQLQSGDSVVLTLSGGGLQPLSDPYLRLYGGSGTLLAFDDDGGGGFDSRIAYTAPTSGTYYLCAGAYDDNFSGQYDLGVAAPNTPPTVTQADLSLAKGEWFALGTAIGYSDADGDGAAQYEIWDDTGANSFWLSGQGYVDATSGHAFSASELSGLWVQGEATAGTQTLRIRAHDGNGWGAWESFDLVTQANEPPTVTQPDIALAPGEWHNIGTTLAYADADGDAALHYEVWDDDGGDSFWLYGSGYLDAPAGARFDAGRLDGLWVQGAAAGGTQTLWVRAHDGSEWGPWESFTLTTATANNAPTVTQPDIALASGEWHNIGTTLAYADADGDAALHYEVWDDDGGDSFWLYGSGYLDAPAGARFDAGRLDGLWVQGAAAGGTQTLWVRAHDGSEWGPWESFTLTTGTGNSAPVATHDDIVLAPLEQHPFGTAVAYSDADGDAAVTFEIWDSEGADSFLLEGGDFVDASAGYTVPASEIDMLLLQADADVGRQTLWLRAHDGVEWGPWDSFLLDTV